MVAVDAEPRTEGVGVLAAPRCERALVVAPADGRPPERLRVPEHPEGAAGRHRYARISRRPSRARPRVISSAYSRSPPTGNPLASRVTRTGRSARPLGQVHGGRLALEVRVGGQDELGDPFRVDASDELANPEVLGSDALERVERALQHVVAAPELSRALEGRDRLGLFDDADDRGVAAVVLADLAQRAPLGHVEAALAERGALLHRDDGVGEPQRVLGSGSSGDRTRSAGPTWGRSPAAGRARRSVTAKRPGVHLARHLLGPGERLEDP